MASDWIVDHSVRIAETASVDASVVLGARVTIWDLARVRGGSSIGADSSIGSGAHIGSDVVLGCKVKVQNNAQVFGPAWIADGVFIGPGAILTNDRYPRAVTPDEVRKNAKDWIPEAVHVGVGASIGGLAVCVAPVTIGTWAFVAAGAVVTADVPDFALVVGVPARRVGWVGRAGRRLVPSSSDTLVCQLTGEEYVEVNGKLKVVL